MSAPCGTFTSPVCRCTSAPVPDFTPFALGMTIDYWLLHGHIGGMFDYYVGAGACGRLAFDPTTYAFGVRVPLGLQAWVLGNEQLEVFLEVAPAWVPIVTGGFAASDFQAQCALGFRIWL
jgi:hypothetical protein